MKDLYDPKTENCVSCLEELYQDEQTNKAAIAQLWRRCVDFANGRQNFPIQGSGFSVNNQPDFTNLYADRSQLFAQNEIEPIVRTLVSFMTRSKPTADFTTADNSDESKNRAKMAERINEAKYQIDNEYKNSKASAFWALVCGNVFRKDYWDSGAGSAIEMPVFDELGNEVLDAQGRVVTRQSTTGDSAVSIVDPFRISVDWSVTDMERQQWIIESYLMPTDWARQVYDVDAPGYTGKAKDISDTSGWSGGMSVYEELKYSLPYQLGGYNPTRSDRCLIKECYIRPNKDYPKGRLVIIAGNTCVYDFESPYSMDYKPLIWHPYTKFGYEPYIGRFWDKGLVEQLLNDQMRLNEINGSIIQNANTMAKPNIVAPENSLKKGIMNGLGNNVYTYRVIPGGAPPNVLPGAPLPMQFFQEKQSLIDAMVRRAATNFVMQGEAPKGVTAASAIEQLMENATSQYSDLIYSWADYHEKGFGLKLRLIRKFNKEPNEDLINYIRTLDRTALNEEISSFIGEDLGDFNLKIDQASMLPKSLTVKRQLYEGWAKEGLLGPELGAPTPKGAALRKALMKEFGEDGLETDDDKDIEKAEWENDKVIKGEPVEVFQFDNDAIHLYIHINKLKDPSFIEKTPPPKYQALMQHVQAHIQAQQMKQQAMQPPAPPMPGQLPAPHGPAPLGPPGPAPVAPPIVNGAGPHGPGPMQ